MNDLVHSLAEDFSAHFMLKNIASEPIDEYLPPLTKVLGKSPTEEDMLALYRENVSRLHEAMEARMGIKLDPEYVKVVFRQGIRNWVGQDRANELGI